MELYIFLHINRRSFLFFIKKILQTYLCREIVRLGDILTSILQSLCAKNKESTKKEDYLAAWIDVSKDGGI